MNVETELSKQEGYSFAGALADTISSGDDQDDAERSDDVGADTEQMREYLSGIHSFKELVLGQGKGSE